MKAKSIKKVLSAKVAGLASHIALSTKSDGVNPTLYFDSELPGDVAKGTVITGGCIISLLCNESPNDYDIYFKTRELALRVARFFLWQFASQNKLGVDAYIELEDPRFHDPAFKDQALRQWHKLPQDHSEAWDEALRAPGRFRIVIKSAGVASSVESDQPYRYFEMFPDEEAEGYIGAVTATDEVTTRTLEEKAAEDVRERGPHHPCFMSGNAITLTGKLQVIIRFWGEPREIHENYDFVHCTCSYTSWDDKLELPQAALEALLTKELRYIGSKYPLCSIIRLRKFIARGWRVNAGQILKICMNLNQLDLTDLAVLEDQLTGVDAAYFQAIVSQLQDRQEKQIAELMETGLSRTQAEEKIGGIDSAYLTTIIDKIF